LKYLLDTNIVSLVARKHGAALARYERHLDDCALASIVWHELQYGLSRMRDGRVKRQFAAFYATIRMPVLPYDKSAAEHHAAERARLRSSKFVDGQIAAIAVTNGLVLVTANTHDFKAFRALSTEDWSKPARA
jgi:tRNA(fMet)-specific endonuclease VapC